MNGFLYLMLCAIAGLSIAACANDDTVQPNDKEKPNDKNITATFAGLQPEATTRTRTTATHAKGQEAKVFWDAADKVYVQLLVWTRTPSSLLLHRARMRLTTSAI